MVISETLRIYPPVVVGDRIASVDYKYNDFIFPKGSVLQFAIWVSLFNSNWLGCIFLIEQTQQANKQKGTAP
jgi:cytochrome P450